MMSTITHLANALRALMPSDVLWQAMDMDNAPDKQMFHAIPMSHWRAARAALKVASMPTPACPNCNDTGSQSCELDGYLDCSCAMTDRRVALNQWYAEVKHEHITADLLWLAYLRGKNEATK